VYQRDREHTEEPAETLVNVLVGLRDEVEVVYVKEVSTQEDHVRAEVAEDVGGEAIGDVREHKVTERCENAIYHKHIEDDSKDRPAQVDLKAFSDKRQLRDPEKGIFHRGQCYHKDYDRVQNGDEIVKNVEIRHFVDHSFRLEVLEVIASQLDVIDHLDQ
jgi:hypothetical protein